MPEIKPGEVIIEYTRVGNSVRVTAVDVATGTEVTFQAPSNASTPDLQRIAINKLTYVMNKRKS
ncbi:MAG: hypothetical protein SFW62_00195 [Alphaproteobacteria bacterium]|nr:hypothetical protein [Alphaproteobacteria bacterium]